MQTIERIKRFPRRECSASTCEKRVQEGQHIQNVSIIAVCFCISLALLSSLSLSVHAISVCFFGKSNSALEHFHVMMFEFRGLQFCTLICLSFVVFFFFSLSLSHSLSVIANSLFFVFRSITSPAGIHKVKFQFCGLNLYFCLLLIQCHLIQLCLFSFQLFPILFGQCSYIWSQFRFDQVKIIVPLTDYLSDFWFLVSVGFVQ